MDLNLLQNTTPITLPESADEIVIVNPLVQFPSSHPPIEIGDYAQLSASNTFLVRVMRDGKEQEYQTSSIQFPQAKVDLRFVGKHQAEKGLHHVTFYNSLNEIVCALRAQYDGNETIPIQLCDDSTTTMYRNLKTIEQKIQQGNISSMSKVSISIENGEEVLSSEDFLFRALIAQTQLEITPRGAQSVVRLDHDDGTGYDKVVIVPEQDMTCGKNKNSLGKILVNSFFSSLDYSQVHIGGRFDFQNQESLPYCIRAYGHITFPEPEMNPAWADCQSMQQFHELVKQTELPGPGLKTYLTNNTRYQ